MHMDPGSIGTSVESTRCGREGCILLRMLVQVYTLRKIDRIQPMLQSTDNFLSYCKRSGKNRHTLLKDATEHAIER